MPAKMDRIRVIKCILHVKRVQKMISVKAPKKNFCQIKAFFGYDNLYRGIG